MSCRSLIAGCRPQPPDRGSPNCKGRMNNLAVGDSERKLAEKTTLSGEDVASMVELDCIIFSMQPENLVTPAHIELVRAYRNLERVRVDLERAMTLTKTFLWLEKVQAFGWKKSRRLNAISRL